MREIRRVLAPGGYAILSVPQKDHLATTFEDPAIVSPHDRERAYGQWDHVRIYGDDFVARLAAAGLRTTVVDESCFPGEVVRRNVLFPPVLSAHPLATNYRKIFFAQRPRAET
jgi:SAM-dependent methyltransferase